MGNLYYCIFGISMFYMVIGVVSIYFYRYQLRKKEQTNLFKKDDFFLNDINKSLASLFISFQKRVEQVANKVKNHYHAKEVIVSLLEDENLQIINFNTVDKMLISQKTLSFNNTKNIIEKLIINDFFEQQSYKYNKIKQNVNGVFIEKIVNFAIKGNKNEKSLGVLSIIFSKKLEISKTVLNDFLHLISKNIAYNTCLERDEKLFLEIIRSKKKEEKLQKSIHNFDILNFYDIKNKLSLEIKRVERYNNTLSAVSFKLCSVNSEIQKLEIMLLQIIKKSIREIDIFGIWKNDSYIIILPETNIFGAKQVVRKIKNKISDKNFIAIDDIVFALTEYNLTQKDNENEFIKRLEKSLNSKQRDDYMTIIEN